MPTNQFQRMVFAFLTVLVTVHAYVFYILYVVNGATLMEITGTDSVIHAINAQGGVSMFGKILPIWAIVLIEFIFAYDLPFAFFSQLFFIQPLIRTIFKLLFQKNTVQNELIKA